MYNFLGMYDIQYLHMHEDDVIEDKGLLLFHDVNSDANFMTVGNGKTPLKELPVSQIEGKIKITNELGKGNT